MAVAHDMVLDFRPIGGMVVEGCAYCINLAMYASDTHGFTCGSHFNEDELEVLNSREKFVPKAGCDASLCFARNALTRR